MSSTQQLFHKIKVELISMLDEEELISHSRHPELERFFLTLRNIAAGLAVLLFLRRDRLKTEFEYPFTNGDLDFAQVFNNQKRKTLGTMRVKNVDAFGPVNSEGFRKIINMSDLKRRNWFLNREANLYYFYYQKDNAKNIIVLEPSEELVDMIKKYLPMGVYRA